jgi:hypothetical protein
MATAEVDAGRIRFIASASLRDRFAGLAMQSFVQSTMQAPANAFGEIEDWTGLAPLIAKRAYEMADAMLAERAKDTTVSPKEGA